MGDIHKLDSSKPRKLAQTEWSEAGLRLSPVRKVADSEWFGLAMVTLPIGAFLIVYFW